MCTDVTDIMMLMLFRMWNLILHEVESFHFLKGEVKLRWNAFAPFSVVNIKKKLFNDKNLKIRL